MWWHLIDVRHTNPNNNYRMQFAGPFADQKLYFRKTNNSPTTAWSKILMETSGTTTIDGGVTIGNVYQPTAGGLSLGNLAVDYTPNTTLLFEICTRLFEICNLEVQMVGFAIR